MKAKYSRCSPHCHLCGLSTGEVSDNEDTHEKIENIEHGLTRCVATRDIREKILHEMATVVMRNKSGCDFKQVCSIPAILTQFLLDCTSLNLQNTHRIHPDDPCAGLVYKTARDLCYGIHTERLRQLRALGLEKQKKQK